MHYIEQFIEFPAFSNVRTIKIFLNQLLSYQAIRVEKILSESGSIKYDELVGIKAEDFKYFSPDDFINIIGSEDIRLHS